MTQIFGEADEATISQIDRCLAVEEGALGVLCADNHLGYSQPIGAAIAYRDHISPSGVGYDIGCGNKAVRTPLKAEDVDVPAIMDEIQKRISFGMGRVNDEPVDHPVLDEIFKAEFRPQRKMIQHARNQLGTVGAGNHYVDLFADEEDRVWIGVHFGSRGFGHKTASGFLALAEGKEFTERGTEGEMHSPPVVFGIDSELGQAYIEAMNLAGRYAYAGRDVVVDKVLEILGTEALEEVHNHHNFAWRETHGGNDYWVVRKGCTPAFPGQRGFVGATMGEDSVILEGTDTAEAALFSTVHGAGRAMSRRKAAGKTRMRKRWECNNRDCSYSHTDKSQFACPDHPGAEPKKRRVAEQVSKGLIDFDEVQEDLRAKGIELRGGAADEAPGAYKRLDEVLAAHGDTIRVLHRLRPLGVAMAGGNTFDPYKD
jgi:tRNA-splicing ligase RtcB